MTLPGGSTKEFTYDPLMRVESIIAKDPPQNPILDYQYTYDKMDNIVGKSTEHGDYVYDYDDLYRLTTVDNPALDDEGFTYDGVGNRLTSADVVGDWTYNQNNELASYNGVAFSYDENGNTIQKNDNGTITDYVYDIENRLVDVTTNDPQPTTSSYYYDPFGRRLWKDVAGTKTCFLYSEEGLVGEYDGTGVEIKTYGYRPGSTWTTDPLFMKEGAEYYFYHNDHLGTPQKMTGYSGNVVWSSKYESFGEATIEVEDVENNLRFPGQYFDQETGLHYNYHRYYDPTTGRYLRTDPVWLIGNIDDYCYAKSNPVIGFDPRGLASVWFTAGGCAGTHWFVLGGYCCLYTGVNIPSGEVCSFVTCCARVGPGVYVGASLAIGGSVSFGEDCDCGEGMGGFSGGAGVDVAVPGGPGGGGSIGASKCAAGLLGGGAKVGVGAGLSAGLDGCYTKVLGCINTPDDCC